MLKPTWLVRFVFTPFPFATHLIKHFDSPWTQNFLSGIILFLTVGIYLALVGEPNFEQDRKQCTIVDIELKDLVLVEAVHQPPTIMSLRTPRSMLCSLSADSLVVAL